MKGGYNGFGGIVRKWVKKLLLFILIVINRK